MESVEKRVVAYNSEQYRSGANQVRTARLNIDGLPISEEIRRAVLDITRSAVEGTLKAAEAIYNPVTDPIDELSPDYYRLTSNSPTDYETDKVGLNELPEKFNPNKLVTYPPLK